MPDDLRPPPESAHLRWHWLIPHNDYDEEHSREDPEVCEWVPFANRDHASLDYWKTSTGSVTAEGAGYLGWRYHGPCDPAAVSINPEGAGQIERMVVAMLRDLGFSEKRIDHDDLYRRIISIQLSSADLMGMARAALKALSDAWGKTGE